MNFPKNSCSFSRNKIIREIHAENKKNTHYKDFPKGRNCQRNFKENFHKKLDKKFLKDGLERFLKVLIEKYLRKLLEKTL